MGRPKKRIDVSTLNDEELDSLRDELSEKIVKINDQACKKANKFLSVYGLKAVMNLSIVSEDEYNKIQELKQSMNKNI